MPGELQPGLYVTYSCTAESCMNDELERVQKEGRVALLSNSIPEPKFCGRFTSAALSIASPRDPGVDTVDPRTF